MVAWKQLLLGKSYFSFRAGLVSGKLLIDLHENSSLVLPAGEAGGKGGESLRWAK